MHETLFQSELSAAFRTAGWWAAKWPDAAVSYTQPGEHGQDGKMRFALPKPFDLVLCSPVGRFGAIECKLLRATRWKLDARALRQLETLRKLVTRPNVLAAFALNFRFRGERKGVCNRAFLLRVRGVTDALVEWREGLVIDLPWVIARAQELPRKAGGWILPFGLE